MIRGSARLCRLFNPGGGNWIKVSHTADGTMSATHKHSDEDSTVIEPYRVYYGDGARFVKDHS